MVSLNSSVVQIYDSKTIEKQRFYEIHNSGAVKWNKQQCIYFTIHFFYINLNAFLISIPKNTYVISWFHPHHPSLLVLFVHFRHIWTLIAIHFGAGRHPPFPIRDDIPILTFIDAAEPLLCSQSRRDPSRHWIDVFLVGLRLEIHTHSTFRQTHTHCKLGLYYNLIEMGAFLSYLLVSEVHVSSCALTLRGTIMERGSMRLLIVTSL